MSKPPLIFIIVLAIIAVLATRQSAVDEGLDPDGDVVWNRILEVTGG